MMRKISLLLLLFMIVSCGTLDKIYLESELKKAMLTGKVITEEGLPLEGVYVKLDSYNETKTDINGKFLYNVVSFGKHRLIFEKEGYAGTSYEFEYSLKKRRLPYVKVKMDSLNFLINEGFEYLKEKQYGKAKEILKTIKKIDDTEETVTYYEAMYHYVIREYYDAMVILEKLKDEDRDNIYYQLTLVAVYEKLNLFEKEALLDQYIARNDLENYSGYLKKSAEIYRDKLNNQAEYDDLMKEYNKYLDSKKKD